MEKVAYLLVIDEPTGVLAADKLNVPVDKDLVVVETYLLMKASRWDFVVEKKCKMLFVKYRILCVYVLKGNNRPTKRALTIMGTFSNHTT